VRSKTGAIPTLLLWQIRALDFSLLSTSVKISASEPEVIRIAKTNQTRALRRANLQVMVIDKIPYSCKFVNLLVDRHISPHF